MTIKPAASMTPAGRRPAATGDLFLELGLTTGDLPNVKRVVGWTF